MTLYARSDLAYTFVSQAHGGCGSPHSRPVEQGAPVKIWALTCAPCETHLRTDPNWSSTLSEVPETHDERLTREDWEKRGEHDLRFVEAIAAARNARMQVPETLTRALELSTGVRFSTVAGQVECAAGHPNDAGSKFCAECGSALREPLKPVCPNGHEAAAKARFCAECGASMTPALAAAPPAADRSKPLKDWRAGDLKALARDRGLDDSGTRRELLERLKTAA